MISSASGCISQFGQSFAQLNCDTNHVLPCPASTASGKDQNARCALDLLGVAARMEQDALLTWVERRDAQWRWF
jgi:hypothetical protein